MTMFFCLCVSSIAVTVLCYQEENIRGLREKQFSENDRKIDEILYILQGECTHNSEKSLKGMLIDTQAIINNIGVYNEVVKKKKELRNKIKLLVEESKGQNYISRIVKLLKRNAGSTCESQRVIDCSAFKGQHKKSGVYTIFPQKSKSDKLEVYCDMKTDGGGWTVIQRRIDGKIDFERNWKDYEDGFGDVRREHWLGNRYLNQITMNGRYELRIDFVDAKNSKTYAMFNMFFVGDAKSKYRLTISGESGTAGRFNNMNNGMKFSTKDQDNDMWSSNCAAYHGAWWYYNCGYSELNASLKSKQKLRWGNRSYNQSTMMIRKIY
ncbi:fibrinogen C domain-containing protein 1-like [Mytilus californianus]|uniref:fibrinogen C domain-containing protein 1-like n=1 Tax=Mytilus californianus TaxID=6549 RepID=UPI002245270F|nr:fibrinogen C domain-containing protein 1-like [Mytilus californianus]